MTKQSGALAAGIIVSSLLFAERKYLLTLFYCTFTLFVAYIIAGVCVHNSWGMFYKNACLGLKNGTDFSFLYRMFTSQYFLEMVPCYGLGVLFVWLAKRKPADKKFAFIATGAAFSFLFAVITGLKTGSSNNYFTEFLVFVILGLPFVLQNEAGEIELLKMVTVRSFGYVAFLILITSKTVGLFTSVNIEKSIKNERAEYAREQQLYEYVKKTLGVKKGESIFFTDRHFLDNLFVEYAIMPDKDVVGQVYTANPATYDYSSFTTGMNTGLIRYIITTENKNDINEWNSTIPFILFDKNKFRVLSTYLGYTIYVYSPL
jgi:hypothetical protein